MMVIGIVIPRSGLDWLGIAGSVWTWLSTAVCGVCGHVWVGECGWQWLSVPGCGFLWLSMAVFGWM